MIMRLECLSTDEITVDFTDSDAGTTVTKTDGLGSASAIGDQVTFVSADVDDISYYDVSSVVTAVPRSIRVEVYTYVVAPTGPVAPLDALVVTTAAK